MSELFEEMRRTVDDMYDTDLDEEVGADHLSLGLSSSLKFRRTEGGGEGY